MHILKILEFLKTSYLRNICLNNTKTADLLQLCGC